MPIYEYEPDCGHCERCQGRFSLMRELSDPPLTQCPACLQPVHKVISRLGGVGATDIGKVTLDNRTIAEAGFTKYVKKGDGFYVREAGTGGPRTLGGEPT